MTLNGLPSKTTSTMNKKEIAEQFTRQTLEQNPSSLTHDQVQSILMEIQRLCTTVQDSSKQQLINMRILNSVMESTGKQAKELFLLMDSQNRKLIETTGKLHKTQTNSIWQRYWMAILMGVLSTLITNLIW